MPKSPVESGVQTRSGQGRSRAKQRIRRWLSDINDERLSRFGLTPEDMALLALVPDNSGHFPEL
jgi:hypothetical protein